VLEKVKREVVPSEEVESAKVATSKIEVCME
jgi:hypothetical protein